MAAKHSSTLKESLDVHSRTHLFPSCLHLPVCDPRATERLRRYGYTCLLTYTSVLDSSPRTGASDPRTSQMYCWHYNTFLVSCWRTWIACDDSSGLDSEDNERNRRSLRDGMHKYGYRECVEHIQKEVKLWWCLRNLDFGRCIDKLCPR